MKDGIRFSILVTMARMIGNFERPYCPKCRVTSGPDCMDHFRSKGGQRKYERTRWMRDYLEDEWDFWMLRHDAGWLFLRKRYAWMWYEDFDTAYEEFGVTDAGKVRRTP